MELNKAMAVTTSWPWSQGNAARHGHNNAKSAVTQAASAGLDFLPRYNVSHHLRRGHELRLLEEDDNGLNAMTVLWCAN